VERCRRRPHAPRAARNEPPFGLSATPSADDYEQIATEKNRRKRPFAWKIFQHAPLLFKAALRLAIGAITVTLSMNYRTRVHRFDAENVG
jgi:hypothetical protein